MRAYQSAEVFFGIEDLCAVGTLEAREFVTHILPWGYYNASVQTVKQRYLVNAAYDWSLIILAPLWALLLGLALGLTPLGVPRYPLFGRTESSLSLFSGVFTMAHLSIVFFRSHANPSIFKLYPRRFVLVPLLLFTALMLSSWVLVFAFIVSVWWDVYHSGLQTFGFGRLYDARHNADRDAGRSLDRGFNLILYTGPIFAGASLFQHVEHFREFADVGSPKLAALADSIMSRQPVWTALTIGIAVPYLLYYVWGYYRLIRKGYVVSREKVALYLATGLCSVWAWGFNPFGQAFFIMNFFHSLQYFALVGHTERPHLTERLGLSGFRWGRAFTFSAIIFLGVVYGIWAQFRGQSNHLSFSILIAVSLLHFWYDSFIWSVRKGQV